MLKEENKNFENDLFSKLLRLPQKKNNNTS